MAKINNPAKKIKSANFKKYKKGLKEYVLKKNTFRDLRMLQFNTFAIHQ
jgi:hypothetical protein